MTYEDVSSETELAVLENLYDTALRIATSIDRADTLDRALLALVERKIEYLRKNLYIDEGMN